MSRTKMKFVALLTAVLATLGTVGATATVGAVDARPDYKMTGGGWCC